MGIVSGIVVYVITWWVVLFAILPWGVRTEESPDPGHATSAPVKPRLRLKFAVTSVVAAVIWVGIFALVQSDLVSFRRNAAGM